MSRAKVVFLHPNLGIGGAERLVVDAALALIAKGHKVNFVTTHHSRTHCFFETKDGTLPVQVVGDWLPTHVFGRFYALCAYIRMIYAALYILLFSDLNPDIVFCDIISVCIPILQLSIPKVIFYCHFPDQLLSRPGSRLKSLYRAPLNWVEEKTTGCADKVLVNSKFTSKVFKETFKSILQSPEILYPSINTDFFDKSINHKSTLEEVIKKQFPHDCTVFLSINRYERKKNLKLAMNGLQGLKKILPYQEWENVRLIMAGGFDARVIENVEHYEELNALASRYELLSKVYFLKSPSDDEKLTLLQNCSCLLYTPSNEHFGIVPLEAMYCEKPVIAVNSGGPMETVVTGITGFLCEPTEGDFAEAMHRVMKDRELRAQMGLAGKKRFQELFSFKAFTDQLNNVINDLFAGKSD